MSPAEIENKYDLVRTDLDLLLPKIKDFVVSSLEIKKVERIDHIAYRVKSKISFIEKSQKIEDGKLKYANPFKEIQDLIGVRVIVYYLSDVKPAVAVLQNAFRHIEEKEFIPDSPKDFDYQGKHMIMHIPPNLIINYKENHLIPRFFELQVLTLFQHAWAVGEHDLGYKPQEKENPTIKRYLAFLAAQSWGADTILDKIFNHEIE